MRNQRVMAAFVLALSCAPCAASCVQRHESSDMDGAGAHEPSIEPEDKDAFGGDLDVVTPLEIVSGDPTLLVVCLALAPAPVSAKVAFCSSLPDTGMYARCMSHRFNRLEWIGWCHFEFSD